MQVKIGDTIYDSAEIPIMVVLSEKEKELITNMKDVETNFCAFPSSSSEKDITEFMEVERKNSKSERNPGSLLISKTIR